MQDDETVPAICWGIEQELVEDEQALEVGVSSSSRHPLLTLLCQSV